MFEQYIGDGASTFITIVALIAGFAAAMTAIDLKSSNKKEDKKEH